MSNTKPRFYVDGWGKDWFVCSRNHRTVAKCPSKKWANLLCKLLIEADKEKRERVLAGRLDSCESVMVDGVEHVLFDHHEHYLAYSLFESLTEGYEA